MPKKQYKRSNAMKCLDKNEAEIIQLFAVKSGKQLVCRKYRVSINTLVKWINEKEDKR